MLIVSHEHRFIFVKTQKTAGTSVEVALSALAGDDAIVTPVQPPEPGHQPRNWDGVFNPVPELVERYLRKEPSLVRWKAQSTLSHLHRRQAFVNHLPASVIRARLGRRTWDRYFTFCFERDPWDKAVSMYSYLARDGRQRPPFEEWAASRRLPTDWNLYTIGGKVAVDFVGRYERLNDDLARALTEVGITDPPELSRAKGQYRPAGTQAPITPAVDRRIRAVFANEIREFGYSRPAPAAS